MKTILHCTPRYTPHKPSPGLATPRKHPSQVPACNWCTSLGSVAQIGDRPPRSRVLLTAAAQSCRLRQVRLAADRGSAACESEGRAWACVWEGRWVGEQVVRVSADGGGKRGDVQRCWVRNVCVYVWEHGVDVQTQTLWLGAESRVQVHCVVWACRNSIREAVSWLGYLTPVFPRQKSSKKIVQRSGIYAAMLELSCSASRGIRA
jgi:hypothetical protein